MDTDTNEPEWLSGIRELVWDTFASRLSHSGLKQRTPVTQMRKGQLVGGKAGKTGATADGIAWR